MEEGRGAIVKHEARCSKGNAVQVSVEAVVIRADGTRENLGTVAYWHKSPWKRFQYWLKRKFDRNAKFWTGGKRHA